MSTTTVPTLTTREEVIAYVERDGGAIPGARYCRSDGSDLGPRTADVVELLANASGEPYDEPDAIDSVTSSVVNGSDDIGLTVLRYGPDVGIDPLDWLGRDEYRAAVTYEAYAYGEPSDPAVWVGAVLDVEPSEDPTDWCDAIALAIASSQHPWHESVPSDMAGPVWAARVDDLARDVATYREIATAGNGQLTLDGGEVVVPSVEPLRDRLRAIDPDGSELPSAIDDAIYQYADVDSEPFATLDAIRATLDAS